MPRKETQIIAASARAEVSSPIIYSLCSSYACNWKALVHTQPQADEIQKAVRALFGFPNAPTATLIILPEESSFRLAYYEPTWLFVALHVKFKFFLYKAGDHKGRDFNGHSCLKCH